MRRWFQVVLEAVLFSVVAGLLLALWLLLAATFLRRAE